MEKVVHKYPSFAAADEADEARHRRMSGNEKLQIMIELTMPEDPHEAVIERSARIYPFAQRGNR